MRNSSPPRICDLVTSDVDAVRYSHAESSCQLPPGYCDDVPLDLALWPPLQSATVL